MFTLLVNKEMQIKIRWHFLVHSAQDKAMILPIVTRCDLLDIVNICVNYYDHLEKHNLSSILKYS